MSKKYNISILKKIIDTLENAESHLDYCGYGDSWERSCAKELPGEIQDALIAGKELANKYLKEKDRYDMKGSE